MMQKEEKGDGDAAMNERGDVKSRGKSHEIFLFSLVLDSDCSACRGNKI